GRLALISEISAGRQRCELLQRSGFSLLSMQRRAYDTAVEIARQVHLDIPIRTIRGMLAPNEPYEEISIKEMRRPRDDELPSADPENDYFGLFMVACVSYAAPASTRPLYTAGIFEIAFRDGRSIDFRNRGDFVLSAYEIIIR